MKQTEIGLIPDDWEVKRLGDNVDIFRGGSPRPIEKYLTTNADGINWIKIGDVRPNDKYIHQTEEKIISEGKARSREVKKGDFILSNSMSFGRPYILNIDGCIHDGWLTIQNYAVSFDKEYLYYLLGSDEIFKQYVQMAAGSSVQNLNKEKVSDLQLKVPPLPEQQRIAKALSDVDALISTTEKLIQKKKNIKQGTMQELLTGKKRLPGFAKSNNTKMTELGEIPEDWEVNRLGELGSFKNGISKASEDFGFGFPFVNLMDIFGITKISETNHLGLINSNIIEQNSYSLKEGDVLFVRSSVKLEGVGLTTVIKKDLDKTVYSGFILRFREIGNELTTDFKEYVFYNKVFRDSLISSSTVSANTNINQPALKTLIIVYPSSKEEQNAIANVLSSMDKEIETLNTKLEKYRNLKTAMMQQLLTGKIRL